MKVMQGLLAFAGLQKIPVTTNLPGEDARPNTEIGCRPTPENQIKYLYRYMWTDPELRASILEIRSMDRQDGRVKRIHKRTASLAVKGGLKLVTPTENTEIIIAWKQFQKRLHLNRMEKLKSDARGLIMEGNLPLQWVLGPDKRVAACVRMPSETIMPKVGANGVFENPQAAYDQHDLSTGMVIATFPLWQLSMVRLTPDNYDDQGCMGRPYLDASREVWKKLRMTEEDLVIRRRTRAPLRFSHVLEGAQQTEVDDYQKKVEGDQGDITTDFYANKKGSVTAVQGDANLDQIADVVYLLDTFFAGSPAPKGLFGYTQDLNRDILEDLKRDYFEEIDALQDIQAYVYELGFRMDLMLQGINPDNYDIEIKFAERRTETRNQRADTALKLQAMGASRETVYEAAGIDPAKEKERRTAQANSNDPYPNDDDDDDDSGTPGVKITPGNARKGESATSVVSGS